jgi:hypothetical protein
VVAGGRYLQGCALDEVVGVGDDAAEFGAADGLGIVAELGRLAVLLVDKGVLENVADVA